MNRLTVSLVLLLMLSGSALAAERTRLAGRAIQGGLITGTTVPGSKITIDAKPVPVAADGTLAFGLGRDAAALASLKITYPDGETETRSLKVVQRKYRIQRINKVPPKYVTPPPEVQERIKREWLAVRKEREATSTTPHFKAGFAWPAKGRITGVYGSQRIYNGEPRNPHYGVDVAVGVGTPVRAPAAGTVLFADHLYYAGKTLIVDHGLGVNMTFIHLSEILVKPGDAVTKGQVIAKSGNTGRSTGPHLHWGMNWYQVRLDPALVVPRLPKAKAKTGGKSKAKAP